MSSESQAPMPVFGSEGTFLKDDQASLSSKPSTPRTKASTFSEEPGTSSSHEQEEWEEGDGDEKAKTPGTPRTPMSSGPFTLAGCADEETVFSFSAILKEEATCENEMWPRTRSPSPENRTNSFPFRGYVATPPGAFRVLPQQLLEPANVWAPLPLDDASTNGYYMAPMMPYGVYAREVPPVPLPPMVQGAALTAQKPRQPPGFFGEVVVPAPPQVPKQERDEYSPTRKKHASRTDTEAKQRRRHTTEQQQGARLASGNERLPRQRRNTVDRPGLVQPGTASQTTGEGVAPFMLSIGSVGHPYQCKDACKYALKPRGCKDGAECIRCHLCHWSRKGGHPGTLYSVA